MTCRSSRKWKISRTTIDHLGKENYEIPLRQMSTSAEILDWLVQIQHKTWATDETVADLLRVIDEACGGLQSFVCSSGYEQGPVSMAKLIAKEKALIASERKERKAAVTERRP